MPTKANGLLYSDYVRMMKAAKKTGVAMTVEIGGAKFTVLPDGPPEAAPPGDGASMTEEERRSFDLVLDDRRPKPGQTADEKLICDAVAALMKSGEWDGDHCAWKYLKAELERRGCRFNGGRAHSEVWWFAGKEARRLKEQKKPKLEW
jgi:hypothetical protein